MGINIPTNSSLGIDFLSIFFLFFSPTPFFFLLSMNLTVLAGILLAVTLATARRVSLDGKTMQAAGEPQEAMREAARPASLVEKMMNKRMKELATREEGHSTGGLVEKKKQAGVLNCTKRDKPCDPKKPNRCCRGLKCNKRLPRNGSYECNANHNDGPNHGRSR